MAGSPEIAIIGAGMSGLCMAIQLAKAGYRSFTVYEKADSIGGTWRDNTYPGCGCDVPSHLYSYSFERRTGWTRAFAEQPEILDYFRGCAQKYGIDPHVRTGTEILEARFDEKTRSWTLVSSSGQRHSARFVICAVGQLNRPHIPPIEGLDRLAATQFHSARWNHDHDLTGKRVAVVGSAASAVQLVPEIATRVASLRVFQRSPNYIIPKPDRVYSAIEKALFGLPGAEWLYRQSIYWRLEARFLAFARQGLFSRLATRVALGHLEQEISDPELRRSLTPSYPIGCKRILISNDYYPALRRPNVELVTSPIERAIPEGLITADGLTHEVDTVIFATGFRTTEFLAPMTIVGREGLALRDAWSRGAEAYLGVAVSGFPNLFLLYGPNTNLGHNSIIFMVETQVRYVMRCIQRSIAEDAALDVSPEAMTRFNAEIQARLRDTVWAAECGNWYKNDAGKITNNWPDFTYRYKRRLMRPRFDEYRRLPY